MTEILTLHRPQGWSLYRLGQLFAERKEKVSDKDFAPLSVTMNGIVPQLETAAKSDDGDNRKLVRAGDYVINSRSDRKGAGGISEYDGSVSLISIVLKPKGVYPRFAHHLLRSQAFQEEFYRWGHGIVADLWTTRYADMKNIRLFLPDYATQKSAANFLDRETARIDRLIEKKQRLVEVLGEKRTALIENAIVQNGPETRLGHHVDILSGYAFPSADFSNDPADVRLLRGVNIAPGCVRWDEVVYWPRDREAEVSRFYLFPGDVVLGMDRPWISAGIRVAELSDEDMPCLLLQRVCRISPRRSLDKGFMKLLLSSRRFLGHFEPILTGVSVPHISPDQVGGFRFNYVDISRQKELAASVECADAAIQQVVKKVEISLDRLREFRAALITATVTGQLDVETWGKRDGTDRRLDKIEEDMAAPRAARQVEARA